MNMGYDMQMIFHPIYNIKFAPFVFNNTANVSEDRVSGTFQHAFFSAFRAEYNLIKDLGMRAHDEIFFPSLYVLNEVICYRFSQIFFPST